MADAASLHRAMLDAVLARDFDALRALYHPEYVYMAADGVEQPGAEAGVAVARTYTAAFADLAFEVRSHWAPSAEVSIMEFVGVGTHDGPLGDIPPTGRLVRAHVCNIIEARDGLIVREREYYDTMAILVQMGIVGEG